MSCLSMVLLLRFCRLWTKARFCGAVRGVCHCDMGTDVCLKRGAGVPASVTPFLTLFSHSYLVTKLLCYVIVMNTPLNVVWV
jgi:hypothetical protein